MTRFQFILKSFFHYFKANLLVALGVAVSTMVLTGSLIIGDSVRYSLTQATFYRLGETTHLVSAKDRYFRQEMASEMEKENSDLKASPVLLLEGMAVADGGQRRANLVQVAGVDSSFEKVAATLLYNDLKGNELAISQNLAAKLQVKEGDNLLLRIRKASLIPMNAPFVSDDETSVALRGSIKKVVSKEELGRFNLKNSQTAPYNVFVSIDRLNRLMEFAGKANKMLVVSDLKNKQILETLQHCLTPDDAGLQLKNIDRSRQVEVSTERVFLEDKVAETLLKLPGAEPILTYFVNAISDSSGHKQQAGSLVPGQSQTITNSHNPSRSIPYSFVSTINSGLSGNELILNRWAADDLSAKPGDSIRLEYFEMGPLRQLLEKEAVFVLREIVPMDSELCDPDRVPHLPGLSDAGHCREWEAGVPIDLDAIRDKDEKYWEDYKGTPKAFVAMGTAQKLWSNRFGNYTSVRYPSEFFDQSEFENVFSENITPGDLGILVESIRENGVQAARNGTDFSGLFIGLSFFILIAAIILTVLLFRFNLESRSAQFGLLAALGFSPKKISGIFLSEGFVTAFFGGIVGIFVSLIYTRLVFKVLNTLWFDIVRTNVLEINVRSETIVTGFLISLLVSMGAVYLAIVQFRKKQIAQLQKSGVANVRSKRETIYSMIMWLSLVISLAVFGVQLVVETPQATLFFASGGLLLVGLLLLARKLLLFQEERTRMELSTVHLFKWNLSRNRRRSLTVVILFALGTFITVSTGSNKLDLFASAQDKTSGTGGFLYFAETTMPVLFNINDTQKRAEEGLYEDFQAVQFRRLDGDNASCLNLNRIAQPAILGVDPQQLTDRFSFATKLKGIEGDPWLALEQISDDGTIPAIADQTVIQWGLQKKIGDLLLYQNEKGDTLRLKLIAGTTPSIFQGFVIISDRDFLKNYPTSSGSNLFLIDASEKNEQAVGEELQSVFRDYGWEMENTAKRLVEFYSVTNTYLSIFLALGTLGLILGTIGLAVILARTILERRQEIALMKAIGFRIKSIFGILTAEYLVLLFSGVLIGFVTAVIATLPSLLSTRTDASIATVLLVLVLILLNGIVWISALSWFSLRKKSLVGELRSE